MILRLTVLDPASPVAHDVEVTAEPDSSVASLLAALPVLVGDRQCYVGSQPLDPDGTLAESPLVPGVTITLGAPGPDPRTLPRSVVGAIRVLGGPDAGLVVWLASGTHLIARDPGAAVHLSDPYVSRRHAELHVTDWRAASITDLGSGNGTVVDGNPVSGRLTLDPWNVVEIGDDRLQWVPLPPAPLQTTRSRDGRLDFDRAFAPAPALTPTEVVLPATSADSSNAAALLLSGLLPLVIGGLMAAVMRQPAMLLFALLGPVSVLGTLVTERRQRAARSRAFAEGKQAAQDQLRARVAEEERLRRTLAPDVADLTIAATGAGRGLWPRNAGSPDGLLLRVGTADEPATVDLRGEPWPGFERPMLRDVPRSPSTCAPPASWAWSARSGR